MATMTTITCACGCGRKKEVRTADVQRGWGKYFGKKCKAKHQEQRTGQYRKLLNRQNNIWGDHDDETQVIPSLDSGPFGHGQW